MNWGNACLPSCEAAPSRRKRSVLVMEHDQEDTSDFAIPPERFDDSEYIERRVGAVPQHEQGPVRTALRYLYLTVEGPLNLPLDRRRVAEPHLEPRELIVARWLATRTNGNLRKTYGPGALLAARAARYRCERCGYADVRAIEIDHVEGRTDGTPFACLCANCHRIKSRASDWSGTANSA